MNDLDPTLELPPKPRKPDLDECCDNGCDPCVFDRYHDAIADWKRACREVEARRKAAGAGSPKGPASSRDA